MKIRNIIFDFGGVLVDWNPRYLYTDLFDSEEEMEYFLTKVCNSDWNEQQDEGRPIAEATKELLLKFPEYSEMIHQYYDKFDVMLKGEITQNVDLLYRLKDRFRLFGLTNWSGETFPLAIKKFPFIQEFEGIVVSGEEKMMKPGTEIFYLLLERHGLMAEESIYIDDNARNVEVARKIGFHAIHFYDGTDVGKQLESMNLL